MWIHYERASWRIGQRWRATRAPNWRPRWAGREVAARHSDVVIGMDGTSWRECVKLNASIEWNVPGPPFENPSSDPLSPSVSVHESSIRSDLEHEPLRPGFRNHTHGLVGQTDFRAYPFLDEVTTAACARGGRYCSRLVRTHQLDSARCLATATAALPWHLFFFSRL